VPDQVDYLFFGPCLLKIVMNFVVGLSNHLLFDLSIQSILGRVSTILEQFTTILEQFTTIEIRLGLLGQRFAYIIFVVFPFF
jgi:hypothetical protein